MRDRRSPAQREFDDRPLVACRKRPRHPAPLWQLGLVIAAGAVLLRAIGWIF